MNQILEINKDGYWVALDSSGVPVYYNFISGIDGNIATRGISYSNTVSLPFTKHNKFMLGINTYDDSVISEKLNNKIEYRLTNNMIESSRGYLIINNLIGSINVNLYPEEVELFDQWGNTSLRSLLADPGLAPSQYLDELDEAKNYYVPDLYTAMKIFYNVASPINHPLLAFPNTLNAIGEKFNVNTDGSKGLNALNTFQSRPAWNAKAILDLACYKFGYTPEYSTNVSLMDIKSLYVVSEGKQRKSIPDQLEGVNYLTMTTPVSSYITYPSGGVYWYPQTLVQSPNGIAPNTLQSWSLVAPPGWDTGYEALKCIIPVNDDSFTNTVEFRVLSLTFGFSYISSQVYAIWIDSVGNAYTSLLQEDTHTSSDVTVTVDKALINVDKPVAGEFVGLMCLFGGSGVDVGASLPSQVIMSSYSSAIDRFYYFDGIVYDDHGQYIKGTFDLTDEATDKKISEIISSILKLYGIFIRFKGKVAKFYSVNDIIDDINSKDYQDLTDYYVGTLGKSVLQSDTIGQTTNVQLESAYRGNTYKYQVSVNPETSRLKANVQFKIPMLDVSNALVTPNTSGTSPKSYIEFTNLGVGFVQAVGVVFNLRQTKVDEGLGSTLGPVHNLANFNFNDIPLTLKSLLDTTAHGLKVSVLMRIPPKVMSELDTSKPVYIEQLMSSFIIDKVKEYSDGDTIVTLELIKI